MKKQKQSFKVLLLFLAMLLLCSPASALLAKEEKDNANDKPPLNIEIFVYDLTGGCVAQETSCKKEVLLAEKKEFYKQLIDAAELDDVVTLQLFNARYPSQQARLKIRDSKSRQIHHQAISAHHRKRQLREKHGPLTALLL